MDTEQRATLGLWSIQGVGPGTIKDIRLRLGPLGDLLEKPVETWAPLIEFHGDAFAHVLSIGTLASAADRLERACRVHQAQILFKGEPGYPWKLKEIEDAPPLLFALGPGERAPRRKLAIVGTRSLEPGLRNRVFDIALEAAAHDLCIVSGAATGTDQAAHRGAIAAEGETWAFMGCALDEIDAGQREITAQILESGGTVFSEFPPGFRANNSSFVTRNRLISGSSHAVLIFRAPIGSGALHTADYALKQHRKLLANPGETWSSITKGSNDLIRSGLAGIHLDLSDLMRAVELTGEVAKGEPLPAPDLSMLGELAKQVLTQLESGSSDFEGLLEALPAISSGELSGALVDLEVFGAVVHKGGRRYEKR